MDILKNALSTSQSVKYNRGARYSEWTTVIAEEMAHWLSTGCWRPEFSSQHVGSVSQWDPSFLQASIYVAHMHVYTKTHIHFFFKEKKRTTRQWSSTVLKSVPNLSQIYVWVIPKFSISDLSANCAKGWLERKTLNEMCRNIQLNHKKEI